MVGKSNELQRADGLCQNILKNSVCSDQAVEQVTTEGEMKGSDVDIKQVQMIHPNLLLFKPTAITYSSPAIRVADYCYPPAVNR
jgi:hypothetical protein